MKGTKIQDRGHTGNEGNENSRPGTLQERRERRFKTGDTPGMKGTKIQDRGHTGNEGNEDSRPGTHWERRERWRSGHFDWLKRIAEVSMFRIISTFRQCRNISS